MKKPTKSMSICIPTEDLEKLRYIAKQDCRSVSSTIRMLVNHCIQEFEKEHGEIS